MGDIARDSSAGCHANRLDAESLPFDKLKSKISKVAHPDKGLLQVLYQWQMPAGPGGTVLSVASRKL